MRAFLTGWLCVMLFANANAQLTQYDEQPKLMLALTASYHYMIIGRLNEYLTSNGLNKAQHQYMNLGIDVMVPYRRSLFILGADLDSYSKPSYNLADVGTSSFGYAAHLHYGYMLDVFGVGVVPYTGISTTYLKVQIADHPGSVPFQSVATTRNAVNLNNRVTGLDLGLKILGEVGDGEMRLGLDVRYTLPGLVVWDIDDQAVTGGPKTNTGGFRIGVIYAFGIVK